MNPRIDEAALAAAGAGGPNPPPLDRLRAATAYAMEQAGADQLILFGSAARGEFGPQSDFDFIAVAPPGTGRKARPPARWDEPTTGDEIDVWFADAQAIEAARWTVGTVYYEAMSQGMTVANTQAAGTRAAVATERDPGYEGPTMPRQREKHLDLSEAEVLAKQARAEIRSARTAMDDPPEEGADWPTICCYLSRAAEKALKSLHVAHGEPVIPKHDLAPAWRRADELGERFAPRRNDRLLNEMTLYASTKSYGTPSGWNPRELAEEFRPTAEALCDHATRRVPELLAEHERSKTQGDEAPMRPSAKAALNKGGTSPAGPDRGRRGPRR